MFTKKEEFTNTIQFKVGLRFDDLSAASYQNINELTEIFMKKDLLNKWKTLPFFNFYYDAKQYLENLLNTPIDSEFNIEKRLNSEQKQNFITYITNKNIKPIVFFRPQGLVKLITFFPVIGILVPMLISTYLITAKDFSGWTYLSGLFGLIIWLLLISLTKGLKTHIYPEHFLDYLKSTYVIRYRTLSQEITDVEMVKKFIQEELAKIYGKEFGYDELID
jgi:hypothetical protein